MNHRFNIFLVTDFNTGRPELNQVTQLTNLKFGDARYPTQYSNTHFTFVSDLNGVGNRYAGYFTTQKSGLDTLVLIGDDILRNPSSQEVDSVLKIYKRSDIDSVAVVSVSSDSAYIFPLTNYESSLLETREAGDNHQVSEVTRQSDDKILYKLKIDENALIRRNVNARTTEYMKHQMEMDKISKGQEIITQPAENGKKEDIFQNEFKDDKKDTVASGNYYNGEVPGEPTVLSTAKLYRYKPLKFATDYVVAGFNNSVLGTKYQLYQGGSGPINLTSNNGLDGTVRMGIADIMEDVKISGGYRLSTNLKDNDWLLQFSNLRRRVDWGLTYYRNVQSVNFTIGSASGYPGKIYSNLYQANVSYPLDEARSVRLTAGFRKDRAVINTFDDVSLTQPDFSKTYGLMHLEYVYDNTLNPVQNIWNGIRYKAYFDWNSQISKLASEEGRYTFNFGFDARGYYPIYRNFIWAGRVAGDFSWGNQKLIYYLGGIDNWFMFGDNVKTKNGLQSYRYFNPNNQPDPDVNYAFQSLAVNLRGFIQNAANGNNDVVINSEFRLPVFTTFLSKPINNAFVRNFQLVQFIDLGSAWNGAYDKIGRPSISYTDPSDPTVQVNVKAAGVGPFLGGYGFGARSTLLGYFLKIDAGWPMNGFFKGKPIYYFSMGLDF